MRQKITLMLTSTVLAFILLEVSFRFIGLEKNRHSDYLFKSQFPDFKESGDTGLYYAHPYFSYDMKKNHLKTDTYGFRKTPTSAFSKGNNSQLIVAIGGSTTYGIRNAPGDDYPSKLETILKTKYKLNYDVVNAGLVNATTVESLNRLALKIVHLKPKVVIIYHGINDLGPRVANNFKTDYSHYRINPLERSYFWHSWFNKIFILRFLKAKLFKPENLFTYTVKFKNIPKLKKEKIQNFRKSNSSVFESNLNSMISILKEKGITVLLPTFAMCKKHKDTFFRDIFPDELWKEGIKEHNVVIKKLIKKHDLPDVDLAKHLNDKCEYFLGQVHFNKAGNAQRSEYLARFIGSI